MLVRPLLLTSLLLGTVSATQSASAKPPNGIAPARLARTLPMYHVEAKPIVLIENYTLSPDIAEENNLGTASENSPENKLQDIINNLKEKCKINLSGTFDSIGKLIKALKKLEAEELVACNISREAANLGGNYFLISEEAIEGPPGEAIHTEYPFFEEFAPPESELIEEETTDKEPVTVIELDEEPAKEEETETAVPAIEIIEEAAKDEVPAKKTTGPKFTIKDDSSKHVPAKKTTGPKIKIEHESSKHVPVMDISSPELESPGSSSNDSEKALLSVSDLLLKRKQAHSIPAIRYVSPEMELAEFKAATSTVAPIPDLGFVSLGMAKHKIVYRPEKPTTTESDLEIQTSEKTKYKIKYIEKTTETIPVLYLAMPEEEVVGEEEEEEEEEEVEVVQNPMKESTKEMFILKPVSAIAKRVTESPTLPVLEYEEVLYPDPDEKRIQKVLQNFQRKTQEDQLTQGTQTKGRKISKRNEPSEDFQEDNWSPVEKDKRAENVGSGRSLPDFDGDSDDEDTPEESLPDNDSDIVEKKLDELEANIMSDTDDDTEQPAAEEMRESDSNDEAFEELMAELDSPDDEVKNERSKLMNGNLQRKFTDDEMVQNSVNRLQANQPQATAKPMDIELISVNESTGEISTEELMEPDLIKHNHVTGKQSVRDMVEDLIAASLIAVFVILALIAMFYTVSFVRSKEKEKCPTITIIESGSPEGTRKYTVGSSRKHASPVCYGKIVKPPRQRQGRHKRDRIPIRKTVSSNISTETSNRTAETVALPPPQIRAICPRPLRSHVSRAYSPRPLSPHSVGPCPRPTQLPPTHQTLIPLSHQQYKQREPKRSRRRDTVQRDYQATPSSTPRKLSLQDVGLPILSREISSPDYQPSQLTTPRKLSLRDLAVAQEMTQRDYQVSKPTSPRRVSTQNVELPILDMDTIQPQYQASQSPSSRKMSLQEIGMPILGEDMTLPENQVSPPLSPRKVSLQDTGLPIPGEDTTLPPSPLVTPRKLSLQKTTASTSNRSINLSRASSPRKMSDAGLPVPDGNIPMPEYPEPNRAVPKRISLNDLASLVPVGDTLMPVCEIPVQALSIPNDNGELTTSDTEAMQPDYESSIPSTPRMVPIGPPFPARAGSMHSVSAKHVRVSSREISPKQLSLSVPRLSTIRPAMRSQTANQYPYQSDTNVASTYPSSMRKPSTKLMPSLHAPEQISEAYDTLDSDSPEISSRSPYISDDGGDVSVESYADPVIPLQCPRPQASLSPLLPQPRQVPSRQQPAPLSLSYVGPPQTRSSLRQRPWANSMGPSTTFQPNQFAYQGGVSAGDFSPRLQYIPKESDIGMFQPVNVQSSGYAVSPHPLSFNQRRSTLSSPYLPEESHVAHMRLMQQIPQDEYPVPAYLPDEMLYANRSYIEQQSPYISNARVPYAFQNQPSMDGSYVSMPHVGSYIATAPSIQGWISTGAPTAGEVSISNIASQGNFANIPSENLQSRHESFYQPVASSPSYTVPQQSPFPSYQQLSRSRQGSDTDAYLRSQGTLQSPLPNVPPPLSPFARSQSQIQQPSLSHPSFQPLSPLSLTLLRDHAADRSQAIPSGSQSSNLYDPFRTTKFENSDFLKGSPISQSFIHKDYSSPLRSPVAPLSQLFNLSPQRFSSGDEDVFIYPGGPQNVVSTPVTSRMLAVGIDPEAFRNALHSTSSISSASSGEDPYSHPSHRRNVEGIFPTSSDSVYNTAHSALFREQQAGLPSDYSINEISSDPNQSNARYYTARNFFNDSSDYLTSSE